MTRPFAAGVPSQAAAGQCFMATRPLLRSRPARGWSLGYPRGTVFRGSVPWTSILALRRPLVSASRGGPVPSSATACRYRSSWSAARWYMPAPAMRPSADKCTYPVPMVAAMLVL